MRVLCERVLLVQDPLYFTLTRVGMKAAIETSLGSMAVGFNLFRLALLPGRWGQLLPWRGRGGDGLPCDIQT